MPIDTYLWNLVQEHKPEVIAHLLRRFDPSYGSAYPDLHAGRCIELDTVRAWLISRSA